MGGSKPHVSVVMATYNRSNIIGYSIESALRQRMSDLELIVIGDCCTDDTQAVVASFDDPRIRFINLPRNVGEQSGPNNVGIAASRGSVVAFLNHDDLWFDDHLEAGLHAMNSTGAELIWTLGAAIFPDGSPHLTGSTRSGAWATHVSAPASTWLVQKAAVDRVGPWRAASEMCSVPSQDWLWRANRAGLRMRSCPVLTVVAVQSGSRRGSYSERQWLEHADFAERIRADSPSLRESLLTSMAITEHASSYGPFCHDDIKTFRRKLMFLLARSTGRSVAEVYCTLRFHHKGGVIDRLREVRGLEPLTDRSIGPVRG